MKKISVFMVLFFLLSGCASKTTVILLPDEDGATGSVIVKDDKNSVVMDDPYNSVSISDSGSSEARQIDKEQVEKRFTDLIEAQPTKPVSFVLYFILNGSGLTDESQNLIPEVVDAVRNREPSFVSIIGHSDSAGKDSLNLKLSRIRAEAVKKILLDAGLSIDKLLIDFHGEHDPLIPTGDDVREPKNRRVEIMVR